MKAITRRISTPRRLTGEFRCRARDRFHLGEVPVAMQGHVAAGRQRRARALGQAAGQRPHREIVTHQQTVESDEPANHLTDDSGRSRGRKVGIDGCEYNVGRHPQRERRQRPKCGEIR